jgi:uncharacterized protein (TIGR02145 family)
VGATNSSGFTALPGGLRVYDGFFSDMPTGGYWWSSSVSSVFTAWYRAQSNSFNDINRLSSNLWYGFSVRCLKD